MKEYFKKWRKKSRFSKGSDIVFLLFIITLLFPQGRMAVGGFINQLKSKIAQPGLMENKVSLRESSYNWNLSDLNDAQVEFSTFKDKVIFLNLWATWCPPCVGEMPGIQKLYDKYKNNQDVAFLMVSNEDLPTISSFMQRKGYDFPVYSNKEQGPPDFSTKSIPTTFVINKKGEIVMREVGAMNWSGKKMTGIIDQLLNE